MKPDAGSGRMPDLVTFDCYGTLIDWRAGIAAAFDEAVPGAADVPRDRLFAAYATAEAEVEGGPYQPYRRVLVDAAALAAESLGLRVPDARRSFLADSLPSWKPFPDTNPALERLVARRIRLGILSNIDDDLLARTLRHLSVPFDELITAQSVRSYKPGRAHFLEALERVDRVAERIVHTAESYYHDVQAARPLGIRTVWVNRTSQPTPKAGPTPTAEVGDLAQAVTWILQLPLEEG